LMPTGLCRAALARGPCPALVCLAGRLQCARIRGSCVREEGRACHERSLRRPPRHAVLTGQIRSLVAWVGFRGAKLTQTGRIRAGGLPGYLVELLGTGDTIDPKDRRQGLQDQVQRGTSLTSPGSSSGRRAARLVAGPAAPGLFRCKKNGRPARVRPAGPWWMADARGLSEARQVAVPPGRPTASRSSGTSFPRRQPRRSWAVMLLAHCGPLPPQPAPHVGSTKHDRGPFTCSNGLREAAAGLSCGEPSTPMFRISRGLQTRRRLAVRGYPSMRAAGTTAELTVLGPVFFFAAGAQGPLACRCPGEPVAARVRVTLLDVCR